MTDIQSALMTPSIDTLRAHWKMLLARGIIFVLIGVGAVALPFAATLATELLVGWLFIIAGFVRFFALLSARRLPGYGQSLFLDVIMICLGILLIVHPLGGELTLTMLLAAFFVFEAFTDFYVATHFHRLSAGPLWLVLSGIASLIIAAFIFMGWPATATWALGLLIGINLIFRGAAIMTTAIGLGTSDKTASSVSLP